MKALINVTMILPLSFPATRVIIVCAEGKGIIFATDVNKDEPIIEYKMSKQIK